MVADGEESWPEALGRTVTQPQEQRGDESGVCAGEEEEREEHGERERKREKVRERVQGPKRKEKGAL